MSLLSPFDRVSMRLGAQPGRIGDVVTVDSYGDPPRERDALSSTAAFVLVNWRAVLHVTGRDRIRFLHNTLTADIRRVAPGSGCHATLCNRQGKMVAEWRALVADDAVWLDTDRHCFGAGLEELTRLIIADRVTVHNLADEWTQIGVWGPNSREVLFETFGQPPPDLAPCAYTRFGEVLAMRDITLGLPGYSLWLPWAEAEGLTDRLLQAGARAAGARAWEFARIRHGFPRWGAELAPDLLPVEAGLDDLAVSYDKGCYIGQEVLLRLRNFSQPVKRLCALTWTGPAAPVVGDPVTAQGETAGRVTSAIPGRALAILRKPHCEPGARVAVGAAEATVEPVRLTP